MMKTKIDDYGMLHLSRLRKSTNKIWVTQYCPYGSLETTETQCGDWCPLFRELESLTSGQLTIQLGCGSGKISYLVGQDERNVS